MNDINLNDINLEIRDEHGRYLKGIPGGPGRPLGSRNKLSEDFLGDMHAAWLERGRAVIDQVIAERPELFLQAMVKLAQGHRVELGQPRKFHEPRTYEQILQQLEDRAGPAARKLFETFLRKMRRLEAEHQGMPAE